LLDHLGRAGPDPVDALQAALAPSPLEVVDAQPGDGGGRLAERLDLVRDRPFALEPESDLPEGVGGVQRASPE
jgi:hypothetical protein